MQPLRTSSVWQQRHECLLSGWSLHSVEKNSCVVKLALVPGSILFPQVNKSLTDASPPLSLQSRSSLEGTTQQCEVLVNTAVKQRLCVSTSHRMCCGCNTEWDMTPPFFCPSSGDTHFPWMLLGENSATRGGKVAVRGCGCFLKPH